MSESAATNHEPPPSLSLWDAVSIIVGIVVGVSVFKVPCLVFQNVASPLAGLGVWLAAGVLALIGALCYAELATRFRRGGEYVFLSRAFGRRVGFLYGWAQLTGVFSGSIGSMAYVFADYAQQTFRLESGHAVVLSLTAVASLTALHVLGVRASKSVQNVLTLAKVAGLLAILVVGLLAPAADSLTTSRPVAGSSLGLAFILVLYAYGGWNDAAFVAAEVKQPDRNIPRALGGGMLAITVLYLLINLAYFRGLGFEGARASFTPASDLMAGSSFLSIEQRGWAQKLIGVVVMTSALGAVHGLLFTGSRLYAAMGADHPLFASLGRWHPSLKSPVWALLAQALTTSLLIVIVGTEDGRQAVDVCVTTVGRAPIPWAKFDGGFETLVAATSPIFWGFFLLNGVALFLFRLRSLPEQPTFRVPGYPVLPIVFCLTCAYMLWQSLAYAGDLTLLALIPLAVGLPLNEWSNAMRR